MKYQGEKPPTDFSIKNYSKGKVDYHIQLLKDADFIKTGINEQNRELPTRLTWKGHEYVFQTLNSTVNVVKQGIDVVEDLM